MPFTINYSAANKFTPMEKPSSFEINAVLEQILQSELFSKAHRMCRLLRYLIENSQSDAPQQMSEYAIGLDVFDRNPSTYYPGEDPVVRVQMGRLRKRLMSYYQNTKEVPQIRVSIPVGRYEPIIERQKTETTSKVDIMQCSISVLPMHYISDDFAGRSFAKGVNDELLDQLKQTFGNSFSHFGEKIGQDESAIVDYILEGSACIEGQSFKVKMRLIDKRSNAIMYSKLFARPANANQATQIQMAREICEVIQQFMAGEVAGVI